MHCFKMPITATSRKCQLFLQEWRWFRYTALKSLSILRSKLCWLSTTPLQLISWKQNAILSPFLSTNKSPLTEMYMVLPALTAVIAHCFCSRQSAAQKKIKLGSCTAGAYFIALWNCAHWGNHKCNTNLWTTTVTRKRWIMRLSPLLYELRTNVGNADLPST